MVLPMNDVLTLMEAADLLRISERTMRLLLSNGDIPATKVGGSWRFSRAQLIEYVEGTKAEEVTTTTVVRRG